MNFKLTFLIIVFSSNSFGQTSEFEKDSIVWFVNCPAEFPGGYQEMISFINENMDMSDIDLGKANNELVILTFFVESDGTITDLDITNRRGESVCKKDAKPFLNMPNWNPACDHYGPIRERVRIPIYLEFE